MRGKQYDIFISYRRSDGTDIARIFDLAFQKARCRTFLDFNNLTTGRFDKRIENAILDAPVFVMILTKDYFARCNEEDDWVRKEIECAIKNEKVIIPINYDGNLNGIPDYLEQGLKDEIGLHQFSDIRSGTLFNVSFDKMIEDRLRGVLDIFPDNDPQPQPQPKPKPKPVQTDFNTEYNRCMTTEQYPEAFAACLNEAVLRQNVYSIKSKADNAIEKLKGRILIPDCVAHVSYDWLIDRLSEKGYSPIKRHEDSISHKKIRLRISKAGSNRAEITTGCSVNPFRQFLFWIIFLLAFGIGFLGTLGSISGAEPKYWMDDPSWSSGLLILAFSFGIYTILLLIFGIRGIVRFNKRKKKAIQDVAKICLEECER